MMLRKLHYMIEGQGRGIASGYLFRRDVSGGKRPEEYHGGFLYGDALAAAAIVLIMLPIILHLYWIGSSQMSEAYENDRILQDTAAFIEEGKAFHGAGKRPDTTPGQTHFTMAPMESVTYLRTMSDENINGLAMWRYTVRAVKNGRTVYELSTMLRPL